VVSPWMGRKAARAGFSVALGLIVLTMTSDVVAELEVYYRGARGLDFIGILLYVLAVWFFVEAGLSLYEGHKGPPITNLHARVRKLEELVVPSAQVPVEAPSPPPPPPSAVEEPPPPPSEA